MAETNFQKIVRALVTPLQDAEDTLQQLMTERGVNTAVGAQLDTVGALVGCKRIGPEDDEVYRRRIRATIAANKSDGLVEDLITIADLVVFDDDARYVVQYVGTAAAHLRVADAAVDAEVILILAPLIRRAAAAGVRIVVEANTSAPEDAFNFSDGPGAGFGKLPEIDLAPLTVNVDTVVRHRDNAPATLALIADGTGAGSLTSNGSAWTFHFESGVTTVAQFETAINASTSLVVRLSDGVGTMGAGDVLAATALTSAVTGGKLASART